MSRSVSAVRMSRRTGLVLAIAATALLALALASCSDNATGPDKRADLNDYIHAIATFDDPSPANTGEHVLKSAHADTNVEPGVGRFICQVSDYRMDKNLHETTVFNVNDISTWPGALVRGADLDNGLLNPIVASRAAVTVGTDLAGLPASENTRTVANPNHLAVQGALNEIITAYLAQSGGAIGARLGFDETFVEDFQQFLLIVTVAEQLFDEAFLTFAGNGNSFKQGFDSHHDLSKLWLVKCGQESVLR